LTSAFDRWLIDKLKESYKNNKILQSVDSYVELYVCIQTLIDKYIYTLVNDPIMVRYCWSFDSRVEPKAYEDILMALRLHPLFGTYGLSSFDEIVRPFFIFDYQDHDGYEIHFQIQEAKKDAIAYFQFIFDYGVLFTVEPTTRMNSVDIRQTVTLSNQNIVIIITTICYTIIKDWSCKWNETLRWNLIIGMITNNFAYCR